MCIPFDTPMQASSSLTARMWQRWQVCWDTRNLQRRSISIPTPSTRTKRRQARHCKAGWRSNEKTRQEALTCCVFYFQSLIAFQYCLHRNINKIRRRRCISIALFRRPSHIIVQGTQLSASGSLFLYGFECTGCRDPFQSSSARLPYGHAKMPYRSPSCFPRFCQ